MTFGKKDETFLKECVTFCKECVTFFTIDRTKGTVNMAEMPTSNLISKEEITRRSNAKMPPGTRGKNGQVGDRSGTSIRIDAVNASNVDAKGLESLLKQTVTGEVRFDNGSRALYATDGSNYRQVPIGVVIPKSVDDVVKTVAACRKFDAPVLSRGGGTSLAGECCNVAVVIDWSKYLNKVLHIDADKKLGTVQPGCVLDDLRNAAEKYGITFGPDPATHSHNTLGGMIGNDSCGVHSVMAAHAGTGARTADNIASMDILLYDGTRMTVGETTEDELQQIIDAGGRKGEIYKGLRDLRDKYADLIREKYPQIPRRVSGYNLAELLPEKKFNVAAALVGSEGTLVTVLEATCKLIPAPKARSLVVLGFPDVADAGDAAPKVMTHMPIGLEGLDDILIDWMTQKGLHPSDVKLLPDGKGWLLCEFGGDTKDESDAKAKKMVADLEKNHDPKPTHKLFDDPTEEQQIWEVREAGLAATADIPGVPAQWPGWEDSAVPPDKVGPYLRKLRELYKKYDYNTSLYGHFGQGCIHCRLPFDLKTQDGIDKWKRFLVEAAHLVVSFGGSLSGEHGDGQARAQLLPIMFGDELLDAMRQFKRLFDPDWKMNPGKVIDAYAVDDNLRLGAHYNPPQYKTHFKFAEDDGSFAEATLRCVGVGKCRRHEGGVMCPSYMVTKEEADSTRGRAHLLFEMLQGSPIADGWRDQSVYDALDLCLACKGCTAQCPVNVDMPTYKAEFRAHYFEGRLHPRAHYAFGFIHVWARLISKVPGLALLANVVTSTPGLRAGASWLADMEQSRKIPPFAPEPFTKWWAKRPKKNTDKLKVVLFPDTFNNYFHPEVAKAAAEVLEAAGWQVIVPLQDMCCGRPLYDYGFMDAAERWMQNILVTVGDEIQEELPFVFLEPSCGSVFQDDMMKLMPADENAKRLNKNVYLLSDFLEKHSPDFVKQYPLKRKAVVHGHCHHKTVLDFGAEKTILDKMSLDTQTPEDGCCGMAGAFGFETEHFDVAQKCGERVLLPTLAKTNKDTLLVADGFSCREMISQNTDRHALHMAEIIKMAMNEGPHGPSGDYPERGHITNPDPAARVRPFVWAGVGLLAAAVLARALSRRKD